MQWETAEAPRLDSNHRAVTTTFDGWNVMVDWLQTNLVAVLDGLRGYPSGHPAVALQAGDALGLDVYVDGPSTPFRVSALGLRPPWKGGASRYRSAVGDGQGQ